MTPPRGKLKYHCVEVIAGPDGCGAATELKGQRLLSTEAPRLPLASCDRASQCACRYLHHEDRRAGPRRADEKGELGSTWAYTNRRKSRDRRVSGR